MRLGIARGALDTSRAAQEVKDEGLLARRAREERKNTECRERKRFHSAKLNAFSERLSATIDAAPEDDN